MRMTLTGNAILVSLLLAGSTSAQTIDLIPMVDLDRDVVQGDWLLIENSLMFSGSAARLSFPYRPPLEYDYAIEFTLTSGSSPWDNTAQLVSRLDVPFTFSMNAGTGHFSRLEDINGHSVIGNPTLTPYAFVGGQRYTSIVRVRDDRVIIEINRVTPGTNGEILIEYETDYSDLSRNGKWTMPDQLNIGLGGYTSGTTIHSATITVVPEPSTLILLAGLVVLGLGIYGWRRFPRAKSCP